MHVLTDVYETMTRCYNIIALICCYPVARQWNSGQLQCHAYQRQPNTKTVLRHSNITRSPNEHNTTLPNKALCVTCCGEDGMWTMHCYLKMVTTNGLLTAVLQCVNVVPSLYHIIERNALFFTWCEKGRGIEYNESSNHNIE